MPSDTTINSSNEFPFLDIKMFWKSLKSIGDIQWYDGGIKILAFKMCHEPNQRLKCLNTSSTHKSTIFDATPKGVCDQFALLTTFDESNMHETLD